MRVRPERTMNLRLLTSLSLFLVGMTCVSAKAQHTFEIDSLPQVSKIQFPFKQSKTLKIYDLYCVQDHAGINFLLEFENREGEAQFTDIEFTEFKATFKAFSTKLRRRKKKLEASSPFDKKLRRLNRKIKSARKVRKQFKQCAQGQLTSPPDYFLPEYDPSLFATAEENPDYLYACNILSAGASKSHQRLVHGTLCEQDNIPVVRIRTTFEDGSRKYCTATFIGRNVLLSAAHCLKSDAGEARTFEAELAKGYVSLGGFVIPDDFDPEVIDETNDIALLFFRKAQDYPYLNITTEAQPIVGETAIIAGFGKEEYERAVLSLKAGEAAIYRATDSGIYTFFTGAGSNTCRGDSGGPLLIEREGSWVIAGVTSNSTNSLCGIGDTSSFAYLGSKKIKAFLKKHLP